MGDKADVRLLLLDVGGVLLTNGWDRHARERAAEVFDLDAEEVDERHGLTFDTYEEGKITLDEYLKRVIFFRERAFSYDDVKTFMFQQTQPYPQAIDFFRQLTRATGVRIGAVTNEGRELTEYRIGHYGLMEFIQFIVASCFIHCRKPDTDIFRMALDVAQVPAGQAVYVDDRALHVEVAAGMGIRSLHHTDLATTRKILAGLGLAL